MESVHGDSDGGLGPSASQVSAGSSCRTASYSGSMLHGSTLPPPSSMSQTSFDNSCLPGGQLHALSASMGCGALTLVGSAPIIVCGDGGFPGTRPPLDETAEGLRHKWMTAGLEHSPSSHYGLLNRSLQEESPRIQELPSHDYTPSPLAGSPAKSFHSSFMNLNHDTDSGISNAYGNGLNSSLHNGHSYGSSHNVSNGANYHNGLSSSFNAGYGGYGGRSNSEKHYDSGFSSSVNNGYGGGLSNGGLNLSTPRKRNSFSAPSRPYSPAPSPPPVSRDYTSSRKDYMLPSRDYSSGKDYASPTKSYYNKSVASSDSAYNGSLTSPHDLQKALQESEDRRHLLVEKLKDAKNTIQPCPTCLKYSNHKQLQSEKLEHSLCSAKELSLGYEDSKYRERELQKKLEELEKDRTTYQNMRLDTVKMKEEMYGKVTALDAELKSLRTSYNYLEADSKRKQDIVDQTCLSMSKLEEENNSLIKSKENMMREIASLKESTDIARNRNEQLENMSHDHKAELDRLRKDNAELQAENRSLRRQISELKEANHTLKDENASLVANRNMGSDEKYRLLRQLESFQEAVTDLKSTLAATSADKERFFQEKLDINQQLQNVLYEKESLQRARENLEEQIGELHAELAQSKLDGDRKQECSRKTEDELGATKKVSEVLSLELATTKTKLEKALEQNESLEHAKKLAFQQHSLYEQEVKTLEQQVENMRKSMETMRRDYNQEKDSLDDHTIKLKDELRNLKSERNMLEMKTHELEAKCKQTDHTLREHADTLTQELHTWKGNSEKLTSSLSKKENEIQSLNQQLAEIQEEVGYLKANNDAYSKQHNDLTEAREDLLRIQEENRRLLQERTENQQVIQLLEMQKSILARASDGILSKSKDAEKLQEELDEIMSENTSLREKVNHLEKKNNEITMRHENVVHEHEQLKERAEQQAEDCADSENIKRENAQLKNLNERVTQQLTEVEKEFAAFKSRYSDTVPRVELRRLENEKDSLKANCERIQTQYKTLEEVHHRMIAEKEAMMTDGKHPTISSLQAEKNALDSQVRLLSGQITSIESEKKKADNEVAKLESLVTNLQRQLFASSHKESDDMVSMQRQLNQLQEELEDSRRIQSKQEALIHSLKDELEDEKTKKPTKIRQSLDDVGEELTNMRSELHKLMAVIQMKDQEIEQLESQLKSSKAAVADRDTRIDHLMNTCDIASLPQNDGIVCEKIDTLESEKSGLKGNVSKLRRENKDLQNKVDELKDKLEKAQKSQSSTGTDTVDGLEEELEKERQFWQEKLRKELSAKDRQIESLEEQLRHATNLELKKLRRDAGKVDLLKQENRRLQNQLSPASKWNSSPKPFKKQGDDEDNPNDDNSVESYDSSDGLPYTRSLSPNTLKKEMEKYNDKNSDDDNDSVHTLTDGEDNDFNNGVNKKGKSAKKSERQDIKEESDIDTKAKADEMRLSLDSDSEIYPGKPKFQSSLKSSAEFKTKEGGASLVSLTAPRPWKARSFDDVDAGNDSKDLIGTNSSANSPRVEAQNDDGSPLEEKIRSRRSLLNKFERGDVSDSEKAEAYARRRAMLLSNNPPEIDLASTRPSRSSLGGGYSDW